MSVTSVNLRAERGDFWRNAAEMFSFDPNPTTARKAWSSSTCLLYGWKTKLFLLRFVSVALYVVVLVGLLFVSVSPLFVLLTFYLFQ